MMFKERANKGIKILVGQPHQTSLKNQCFRSCAIVNVKIDMKRENQLDATQWFIELMIRSTCFGHYYAHHQEPKNIQMITACGT